MSGSSPSKQKKVQGPSLPINSAQILKQHQLNNSERMGNIEE